MPTPVLFLTDVEGRWDKLVDFCEDNPWVRLDEAGRIQLAPGATFVYGGDVIDRGPASLRLLCALVDLEARHPDRVVLLAGNRDINKLRLPRELAGHPRAGAPPGSRADVLRWTLHHTMGAADAFRHRAAELATDDDERVVESFLDDVSESGPLWRYLSRARLAYRSGESLFVHGAVVEENFGVVPGRAPTADVDAWIASLNTFYRSQLDAFRSAPRDTLHQALIDYQAPLRGTRANPLSVVYARPVDAEGNAVLPAAGLRARLLDQGVRRVVVGHTPSGSTPAIVRADGFELIVADSSYARVERGAQVILDGSRTEIHAWACPDGEAVSRLDVRLTARARSPIGRRDRLSGRLVKGRLADGRYLLFRFLPGFRPEETARADVRACRWD